MSLQFDPETGKITYKGREVGEHVFKEGTSTVKLNIEYTTAGEWVVPLSWFAHGLAQLPENDTPQSLLTLECPENSIAEEFDVPRLLTEKIVKRKPYVWEFHKTDADPWPSPLHGHDYEKGLKLDVLTGKIYDVGTRQHCKTIKDSSLSDIRAELRASKDFSETMNALLPKTVTGAKP